MVGQDENEPGWDCSELVRDARSTIAVAMESTELLVGARPAIEEQLGGFQRVEHVHGLAIAILLLLQPMVYTSMDHTGMYNTKQIALHAWPSQAVLGRPSESLRITSIKTAIHRLKAVNSLQQMDTIVLDLVMWRDDTSCRRQHLVQFRAHALALFRAAWSSVGRPLQDLPLDSDTRVHLEF